MDAVVAAAFAIGVVEPQMSGMGGSGAATVWMKRQRYAGTIDFYAAQFADSWKGHTFPAPQPGQAAEARDPSDLRIVGIPGDVAGLLALHEKFGVLPRERVMAPAIRLAEEGFPVGEVLSGFIASSAAKLKPYPAALALFTCLVLPSTNLFNPEGLRTKAFGWLDRRHNRKDGETRP